MSRSTFFLRIRAIAESSGASACRARCGQGRSINLQMGRRSGAVSILGAPRENPVAKERLTSYRTAPRLTCTEATRLSATLLQFGGCGKGDADAQHSIAFGYLFDVADPNMSDRRNSGARSAPFGQDTVRSSGSIPAVAK